MEYGMIATVALILLRSRDISQKQAEEARKYIEDTKRDHNDEWTKYDNNCVDFVYNVAGAAGVDLPGDGQKNLAPDELADDLKECPK